MGDLDVRFGFAPTADGRSIAYGWAGSGPPLVMVPGWLSHVSTLWSHPDAASAQARLAAQHRFVWYDRWGCGLSSSDRPTTSLDDDVVELVAVLDALDIERTDLIGYSMGGPTSVAFAARYPERVRHLVLYATLARGADLANDEFREALLALIRSGWSAASQLLASTLLPEATAEDIRWFARFQRRAATADNASRPG